MHPKNLKLLQLKDFVRLGTAPGGRIALFDQTVQQFKNQHNYLKTLRIRRPDVMRTFEQVIDSASCGPHDDKKFHLDTWVTTSKSNMSKTFDKIVADGSMWNGQGVGDNALIQPLNEICRQNLYAMVCLDMLSADAPRNGMFASEVFAHDFITRIVDDVSSFSKEKFGVCPHIDVQGELKTYIIPPFIEFVVVEILKNSIKAVIDRYGALDIDDAHPIEIRLSAIDGALRDGVIKGSIEFRDQGIGMTDEVSRRCFDAFYSKTAEARTSVQPSYQYSRDFGAAFSGTGIGLLKSKVFVDFHNSGKLTLVESKENEGTIFTLSV